MWRCIRCNKENQDSIENCTGCGHGKTMDYIHHCTLSRIKLSTADNWKINNNSSSTTYDYSTDGEKTTNGAPRKYPLTQNPTSVTRVLETNEDNWAELKKRKINRSYTGYSIKEICEKFLSYEANKSVDNVQRENSELLKTLQIYQNHNIYLLHDDTQRKNGQSGFAVTDQGIYAKALFRRIEFTSWKKFQESDFICIGGDSELSIGQNSIAFFSGDRDTLLELELMFAVIHEYLNRKPVSQTEKKEKPTLMQDSSNKSWIVTNVFGKSILRENIHEIEFIKTTKAQVPSRAWDVSADQSNTIWAWVTARPQGTTLYIGSENGVYANPTCERLFMAYTNVKRIKFNNLFDTSRVEDMEDMFSYCRNLEEIDVSGFDTSKVVFMQSMFEECRKLKTLDISNFRYKENVITDDMFKNSGITR